MSQYQALDLILDTQDVTVGGGSASAIAAAMAAGLIGMVARLSTKKIMDLVLKSTWPSRRIATSSRFH